MSILCDIKTSYHDIRVIEEYPIRKLIFGSGACSEQSAIHLEKPAYHVYDYSFLSMHSLLLTPYPSKILVIGLGGGVIPTEMEKYTSNSTIDVVEIDPEIVKIAKEYFFFKESDRVKVYIGDAFDLVPTMQGKYDIVIVDAFFSNYTPFNLMSSEFFKMIYNIASEDVVVTVNMANMHPAFLSQINTIRHVFGNVLYRIDGIRNPNDTIVFALKKEKEIIRLHERPLCHFLGIQPERITITDEIKDAKIFSMTNT